MNQLQLELKLKMSSLSDKTRYGEMSKVGNEKENLATFAAIRAERIP